MKEYELITIMNTTSGSLDDAKKALQEILKRHGVRTAREEDWGERKLHHEIEKIKSGHFLYQTCKMEPATVKELERDFNIEQSILRFMVRVAQAA